jgi:hypothetical protein
MRLAPTILLFLIPVLITSCATMQGVNNSNDFFAVNEEMMLEKAKEAIRENNLRIHNEEIIDNGAIQITAYRPEGRLFTSEEQAINRIRVILTPSGEEDGFRVTIIEPRTHAMARTASTVEYKNRILRTLNELLPQNES